LLPLGAKLFIHSLASVSSIDHLPADKHALHEYDLDLKLRTSGLSSQIIIKT
jgi:hypothetical protein